MYNKRDIVKAFEKIAQKYGNVSSEDKQNRFIKDAKRAHLTTPEERRYIITSEV